MRLIALVLAGLLCLVARDAAACSCSPDRKDFWALARGASTIVVAEVTKHGPVERGFWPSWFEVRVKEVLKGPESRASIVFNYVNQNMCTVPATSFPVGTIWAFVLMPRQAEGDFNSCEDRWYPIASKPSTEPSSLEMRRFTHSPLTVAELRKVLAAR